MEPVILFKVSKGDRVAFKYIFDAYYKSICLFIQKYNLNCKMTDSEEC